MSPAMRREKLAKLCEIEGYPDEDELFAAAMTYGWNVEMQMKAARMGLRILEVPMPYRCRSAGKSKVAGTIRGSLRAACRIAATFLRVG